MVLDEENLGKGRDLSNILYAFSIFCNWVLGNKGYSEVCHGC